MLQEPTPGFEGVGRGPRLGVSGRTLTPPASPFPCRWPQSDKLRAEGPSRTLATACPFCIVCLDDSIKAEKIKNLTILDVVEIAAEALLT